MVLCKLVFSLQLNTHTYTHTQKGHAPTAPPTGLSIFGFNHSKQIIYVEEMSENPEKMHTVAEVMLYSCQKSSGTFGAFMLTK